MKIINTVMSTVRYSFNPVPDPDELEERVSNNPIELSIGRLLGFEAIEYHDDENEVDDDGEDIVQVFETVLILEGGDADFIVCQWKLNTITGQVTTEYEYGAIPTPNDDNSYFDSLLGPYIEASET